MKSNHIVTPGELVESNAANILPGKGVYKKDGKIYAKVLGIPRKSGRVVSITPLRGKYLPKKGDLVIGRVVDITLNGWRVDINSPYSSLLPLKEYPAMVRRGDDLSKYLSIDDYIASIVANVSSQNIVDLTMKDAKCKKLDQGLVFRINPLKVSRVIGTGGSMISLIKQKTNCKIILGANGVVWIQGLPEQQLKAMQAVKLVERLAHVQGLTDKIKSFLES